MLLTLDIGNTTIAYGLFQGKSLLKKGKIPTEAKVYSVRKPRPVRKIFSNGTRVSTRGRISRVHTGYKAPCELSNGVYLRYLDKLPFFKIDDVIISSVVPVSLEKFKKELKKKFYKRPLVLGENVEVPIVNLYKRPSEVGQDRLVNAYAGYRLYGGGSIIVDFGTAVTFDLVSVRGEYLGGIIFPGIKISLEALCKKAALLPKEIKLQPGTGIIGKDTQGSICSGIFNGFACLTEGLINLIKKELKRNLKVIITGGDAGIMRQFLRNIDVFKEDLTLKGLMLIYENYQKKAKINKKIRYNN